MIGFPPPAERDLEPPPAFTALEKRYRNTTSHAYNGGPTLWSPRMVTSQDAPLWATVPETRVEPADGHYPGYVLAVRAIFAWPDGRLEWDAVPAKRWEGVRMPAPPVTTYSRPDPMGGFVSTTSAPQDAQWDMVERATGQAIGATYMALADRPRWIAVLTEEEFYDAPLSPSRFESFVVVGEPQPASYRPSS